MYKELNYTHTHTQTDRESQTDTRIILNVYIHHIVTDYFIDWRPQLFIWSSCDAAKLGIANLDRTREMLTKF